MEKQSSEKRFALLIDADNVSAKYIKPILDELSKYGTITIKRIFGDWTSTLHAKWKDALLENSITPIQQFSYTQGKNATDSAMIIDAMDILYTNSVDGFCIVSSDSDFTRLASRIRESGLTVVGMGEKKTPVPFRKACDVFTALELLLPGRKGRLRGEGDMADQGAAEGPTIEEVEQAVVDIITENLNNGKSTGLGEVGSRMLKRYPDFDVRSYGTNLLSKLLDVFKTVKITKDGSSVTVVLTELGEQRARGHVIRKDDETAAAEGAQAASADDKQADRGRGRSGGAKRRERPQSPADVVVAQKPALPKTEEPRGALPQGAAAAEGDEPAAEAQGAEPAAEQPAKPRRQPRRRHGRSASVPAEPQEETRVQPAAEVAVEQPEAPAAEEPSAERAPEEPSAERAPEEPKAPRRRRGRKPKAAAAEQAEAPAEEPQPPVEKAEAPAEELRPEAAEKAPAPKKRRGRKPKASAEVAAPAPEVAEAAAPEPEAAEQPGTDAAPKKRGRKPKPAPTVTPAQFVLAAVKRAPPRGVKLEKLAHDVRLEFRDFKVRDLGFTQFRSFVASIDGVSVEKSGKDFLVKAAHGGE